MCSKAVKNHPPALDLTSECYKTQKIFDKAVDTCPSTIKFVPEWLLISYTYSLTFHSVLDQYKTNEICDRVVYQNPFIILYYPNKYVTLKIRDEPVDVCPATLKLICVWFVTSKIIKTHFTALYADEDILYFKEDSSNVTLFCNQVSILSVNLININLNNNFDNDDRDTILLITLLAWHNKFEKRKELYKLISGELMPVAWHPDRCWDWCVSKNEKKEIDPVFIEEL